MFGLIWQSLMLAFFHSGIWVIFANPKTKKLVTGGGELEIQLVASMEVDKLHNR